MVETKDVTFRLGRGFIEGAGVDQMLYALSAYVPQLADTPGFVVPGYAPGGIHYDDLISLAISGIITGIGAYKRNTNLIAEGVGMLAGNFISSQFQQVVPVPPWSAGVQSPRTVSYDLVQVD